MLNGTAVWCRLVSVMLYHRYSDQEKADTKTVAFPKSLLANRNAQQWIIGSSGTDIAVIWGYHHFYKSLENCTELWFLYGTGEKKCFVAIYDVCDNVGLLNGTTGGCCFHVVSSTVWSGGKWHKNDCFGKSHPEISNA